MEWAGGRASPPTALSTLCWEALWVRALTIHETVLRLMELVLRLKEWVLRLMKWVLRLTGWVLGLME
jgi:hypothetical protein